MGSCKECLHVDACSGYLPTEMDEDVWEYCRRGVADEIPNMEERCDCFLSRTSWHEVVHGRWVQCKDWDYDYECSVCEGYAGEDIDGNYNKLTPYCPNCGAKMDGDGNATD